MDLILTVEIQGARAAKETTSSIPIVVLSCDPYDKLVTSHARRGNNCQTCQCRSQAKGRSCHGGRTANVVLAYLYPKSPGPCGTEVGAGVAPP